MHPIDLNICLVIIYFYVYQQLQHVNTQCPESPRTIEVGYEAGSIKFPESGEYKINQACEWLLISTVSGPILYKSFNIDINCSDSYNIYDGPSTTSPAKETGICTSGSPIAKLLDRSSGHTLSLRFESDGTPTPGKDNGFSISFVSSPDLSSCSVNGRETALTASNATQAFTSPSFPNNYNKTYQCSWVISPSTPDATVILTLSYIDIDMDKTKGECYDKLTINYGPNQNERETVCGDDNFSPNKTYTNGGNGNITVTFTSDNIQEESGFVAMYSEIVPDTTVAPTKSPTTEPPTIESTTTELTKTLSTTTEPSTTQSTTTKPSTTQLTTTEPSTTRSTTTEPSTAQSTTTDPSTTQSTTTEPSTTQSTTTEPSTTQSTTTEPSTTQSTTTDPSTTQSTKTEPSTTRFTTTEPLTTSSTTLDPSTTQPSTTYFKTKEPTTIVSSTIKAVTTGHQTTESTTKEYLRTESTTTKPLTTEFPKSDPPATGNPKADNVLQFEPFVGTISFMFLIVLIPIIIFFIYLVWRNANKKHNKSRPDDSYELNGMSSVPLRRVSYTPKLYDSWTYERRHSKRRSEGVMTANEYSFPQMEVAPYGYQQMPYGPYSVPMKEPYGQHAMLPQFPNIVLPHRRSNPAYY